MLKKKKSFERKRLKHGTVTLSRAPFREQCMKEVLATSHFNCFYLKLSVIFSWEKNMKKISEVLTSVLICRAKALLFLFFFFSSLLHYHRCTRWIERATQHCRNEMRGRDRGWQQYRQEIFQSLSVLEFFESFPSLDNSIPVPHFVCKHLVFNFDLGI